MGILDSLNVEQKIAKLCFFATGLSQDVMRHIVADIRLCMGIACLHHVILVLLCYLPKLAIPYPAFWIMLVPAKFARRQAHTSSAEIRRVNHR